MTFTPSYLKRWTRPNCYFGAEWPDYFSSGVGQSRDSDALERSNFACMLRALGGESETVLVIRESHWAVGWIEWIAIHESDEKALAVADDIQHDLQDYPVISDDHFSEIETEDAQEVWTNCFSDRDRIDYIRRHRDHFEFHDYADLIGCARGRYFTG
ncbi:MAG: hypothetical protein M9955_11695 [Rhizobiaceae bacterium]|nr:hypothetical protein [Rhizobiaceae bacterium]